MLFSYPLITQTFEDDTSRFVTENLISSDLSQRFLRRVLTASTIGSLTINSPMRP